MSVPRQYVPSGQSVGASNGRCHDGAAVCERPAVIPGLDGLRALAILAVLIYHLAPQALSGGFIGVDIFFVVSGFLITTLLLRELAKYGRINLPRFWLRRARRLLPALFVCVIVSITLAFIAGGDLLVGIGRQTIGALTFSNNWVEIFAGSSYFSRTSPQLFLNFWSLAVEEQFYLFWPLLLGVVLTLVPSSKRQAYIAVGIASISAVWMALCVTPGADSTRAYYGTDTHLFGLMIGVTLAFIWSYRGPIDSAQFVRWRLLMTALSFGLLLALMAILSEESVWTFRGGLQLASLTTAILISTLINGANPLLTLFDARPVVWIGERSYGIYLWHWPIILIVDAMMPATTVGTVSWWISRAIALLLTLLIAAASYRWLETPIRRQGFRYAFATARTLLKGPQPVAKIVAIAATICLIITAVAIATAPSKSATQIAIEQGEKELADQDLSPIEQPGDRITPTPSDSPVPTPSEGASMPTEISAQLDTSIPTGEEITAFGDSMMAACVPAMKDRFPGIAMDARSNRQWPEGLDHIHGALAAGKVRRAVVIALGTNAGLPEPAMLEQALTELGPQRLIVIVNIHGKSTWIDSVNREYDRIVSQHPNAIVADWRGAITAQPNLLQSDGVHPDIKGARLFADTIKDAFAALSERATAAQQQ